MIKLEIGWKPLTLLLAIVAYVLWHDDIEAVKKNGVPASDGTSDREARINRRHELTMNDFADNYYQTIEKVTEDYERTATPIRTFTR